LHLRSYLLAGLIALVMALGVHGMAAAQDVRAQIGLLTCGLTKSEDVQSGADAAPLRQTRELLCAFRPTNGGPEEIYSGTLQSVGLEKELSEKRAMIWVVKGTRETVGSPGLLQQVYAADVAANPGYSPPLIGESNMSIVLQTLADEQAPASADKKQQITIAVVVLITLRLKSTPA